ncbi:MAG: rRNA cytosine-C5-methyltransferase [Parabacteroides sp.]|nr:rRNA cytosine-C5-methyltransferase [Parabacteroides sp.]
MALPIDFITRTRALLGNEFDRLEAALQADVPVSIRINEKKGTPAPKAGAPDSRVAWCETGYYLPERLSFTFDPLFHAGAYYVQEASSMFLEQAIRNYVKAPVRCLDLCAAPGGKSTHLLSLLPEGSLLVSNEVIRSRSNILAENIAKWGNPNSIVTNNDPEEIGRLTHLFDVIVTDVPCSGEGMFRKDTDSTGEWSVANVELCAGRQRRIIHDIWNALKPGGLLVYSTCTYNTEEDEENIHYIIEELGAEALSIPVKEEWQTTGPLKYDHPVYRFFPHKTKGEGFFLAVLRKAEGETEEIRFKSKNKKEKGKAVPATPEAVKSYLSDADLFSSEWNGNFLRMHPESVRQVYPLLREHLRILSAGICIGEAKGKDFIPAQELALSTALHPDAFPSVELDWDYAIRYLKKEALLLPDDTEKGYVLLRYKGFPLGFAKHLGNQANNLYPQEWRIRTSYIPEKVTTLL